MKVGRRRKTTYFISAWDLDCPNSTEEPTMRRAMRQAKRLYRSGYRDIEVCRCILTPFGRFEDFRALKHLSSDGTQLNKIRGN